MKTEWRSDSTTRRKNEWRSDMDRYDEKKKTVTAWKTAPSNHEDRLKRSTLKQGSAPSRLIRRNPMKREHEEHLKQLCLKKKWLNVRSTPRRKPWPHAEGLKNGLATCRRGDKATRIAIVYMKNELVAYRWIKKGHNSLLPYGKLGRRKEPTPTPNYRSAGQEPAQIPAMMPQRETIPRSHRGTFVPVMSTEEWH